MSEVIVPVLIFICTGLIGVLWWIIKEYIAATEKWKASADQKIIKVLAMKSELNTEILSVKSHISSRLSEQETRLNTKIKFMREEHDKHYAVTFKQLKVTSEQLSQLSPKNHIDPGRVDVIENKVNRVYDVIKNLKRKKP